MALGTPTQLTQGHSSSNVSSYSSASITPTADALVWVWITNSDNGGAGTVSSVSHPDVSSFTISNTATTTNRRLTLAYGFAGSSPGGGTLDIGFGTNQTGCAWRINEVTGADTTTPVPEVATFNTVTAASSITTNALAGLASGSIAITGACQDNNATFTAEAGWVEIGTSTNYVNPTTEYHDAYDDTDTDCTWSATGSHDMVAGIAEIAEAGAGGGVNTLLLPGKLRFGMQGLSGGLV